MSDLDQWLRQNDLDKYSSLFVENDVKLADLPELTEEDVKELGLPLGPRKRLLKGIRDLIEKGLPETRQEEPLAAQARGEAERRQLTVMFCDLVGSTALSESMDAEDYRDLISDYQSTAVAAIHEHGGYVARYMGDGLLVYFGYPVAQEDDPERATRAGLALIDAVESLDSSVPLEVRVGIATGPVVVGDIVGEGASEEAVVLGETPNLAARLQGIASPNAVVVSARTQRLLRGAVETEALAPVSVKGLSRPVESFRALRPRSRAEMNDAVLDRTELIGRDVEMASLTRAWRHTRLSEGQALLLSGEAGVGKSRLLRAFQHSLSNEQRTLWRWHCSPYFQSTANFPAIDQLRRIPGLVDSAPVEQLDVLTSVVDRLELDSEHVVPLLALLLSVPLDERYLLPDWPPPELRRRLLAVQVDMLLAAAKQRPVILVVEDLHWADPTTIEVLSEMVAAIQDAPVLILMSARPEFVPPWAEHPHARTELLRNLSRSETTALIRGIVEAQDLSDDVIDRIIERTDGIPLYVEELTKSVIESGIEDRVPASLHDLLMARLDRLGSAKELAQTASVIGRAFTQKGLCKLAKQEAEPVESALQSLAMAGLVQHRPALAEDAFEFKHALVRDAAYDSMLRTERRMLHERYAVQLEASEEADSQPELVASHFIEGGRPERALEYLQKAGRRALRRSANTEAVQHFGEALALLDNLPSGSERDALELDMRTRLGPALQAINGFASADVVDNYARAQALCEQGATGLPDFLVAWTLARVHNSRAEFESAMVLGEQLVETAAQREHLEQQLAAHAVLGTSLYLSGSLKAAHEHLSTGLGLYSPEIHASLAVRYGADLGMLCGGRDALALWFLGYPDQAVATQLAMLKSSERTGHAMTMINALEYSAQLHHLRKEPNKVIEYAEQLKSLCDKHANVLHRYVAVHLLEASRAALQPPSGDPAAIVGPAHRWREQGNLAFVPEMLGTVALACLWRNELDDALSFVEEGLAVARQSNQKAQLPELNRVRAAVLQHMEPVDDAAVEQALNLALTDARRLGTRSLELRVSVDLADRWARKGKRAEAFELLNGVYAAFSEGFDTPDLVQARALLAELT